MRYRLQFTVIVFLGLLLGACAPAPQLQIHYDPAALRFSGEQALETLTEFVMRFPHRDSGQPNNRRAAQWIHDGFTGLGYECEIDEWQVINYSRPLPLNNTVCRLEGERPGEILVVAHHDQSPDTIYGADNDGSGIAILLQLAQIFAAEGKPHYDLVFLSSDGEEYGMLGSRRYVRTHPNTGEIIAGLSLDNLGKRWYYNVDLWSQGQFRGYGPLWLVLLAHDAAATADNLWEPRIRSPLDQVVDQAVPISFWDQGPIVAAGVPALGVGGLVRPEDAESVWRTYHSPEDTVEFQSADVLQQSGRIAEATLRELLARDSFPKESGPYIYLQSSGRVLRGAPLWGLFLAFVAVFFIGASLKGGLGFSARKMAVWRQGLPHFLGLWLPMLAAVTLTYLLVAVGLMDEYHLYPATAKNAAIFQPRWPAVIIFLLGLAFFLYLGRRFARRDEPAVWGGISSLAFAIVGLGALYILVINPFSLLFLVPTLAWFFIGGRRGLGRALDLLLFLLGGLVVFALFAFFGFVILRNDWAILWYLLMMFSIQMISFPTAAVITAILAAGLSLVVTPPRSDRVVAISRRV